MGFSFAHWISAEAAAIGHSVSSFATGLADNARFGLKTVVGAPQGIVHEISTGIIGVSKIGAGVFTVGAKEAGQAFAIGAHEGSLAAQSVAKSASGAIGSVGSSLSWPLAAAVAVIGALYVLKR